MTPFRAPIDYAHWDRVALLIHDAFAYMEPVLGHPAKAASVTPFQLAETARDGSAWIVEDLDRPVACLFTRRSRDFADALYLGWLAVDGSMRGRGLAKTLILTAQTEARAAGYSILTLDTGRALSELQVFFRKLGFVNVPGDGPIVSFTKPID